METTGKERDWGEFCSPATCGPDREEAFFVLLLALNKSQEILFSALSVSQVSLHTGPLLSDSGLSNPPFSQTLSVVPPQIKNSWVYSLL